MMEKIKKIIFCFNFLFTFFFVKVTSALTTQAVGQTQASSRLQSIAGIAGFTSLSTPGQQIAASIILYALGLVGLIFLVLMMVGGFQWMTAAGNEEKITKATERFKNAVIGFIVVMLSYAIMVFLVKMFGRATLQ